MNFNLVSGEYEVLSKELLCAFEDDYLNSSLTWIEVRHKYNLSKKQYAELAQSIRDKYGLVKRPYANAKNYYLQGNRWCIIKTNNKVRTYFGSLPADVFSREEIEIIVEKCEELQWNVDDCMNFLQSLGVK